MTIIFKDYHTVKVINSIPRESIDSIKAYMNEIGVVFSEGVVPMNWNRVLAQIRDDFESFIESGAWRFLHQDDKEDGEEEGEEDDSEMADQEFDVDSGEEESESDEDSDFSDEDDDDEDFSSEAEEEDEGLDWDDLEKAALEEDKKAAMRRNQDNDKKPNAGPSRNARKGRR